MFGSDDDAGTSAWPATRRFACALAVLFLSLTAVAGADPVNDLNIQIKDVKPDGRYTVVFSANSYDTGGQQPPHVTSNSLRMASGLRIRPQFLGSRYRCDVTRMRDIILVNPERSPARSQRFADLAATLKRIRKKLTRAEVAVVETCIRAQIGKGVAVADTRPFVAEPVPAKLTLYLSKATAKGAIASVGVIAVLDETSKAYREQRLLRLLGALSFEAHVFDEPSADGRYGYRLALPTPPTGLVLDVKVSFAEVRVTAPGLTARRKLVKCVRRVRGKCRQRRVTTMSTFWLTQPKCPATSKLGFETSYTYETGLKLTSTIQIPCPRFRR